MTTAAQRARRDFACRIFWSLHPACLACEAQHGGTFSLRQLIAFVEAMPGEQFARVAA